MDDPAQVIKIITLIAVWVSAIGWVFWDSRNVMAGLGKSEIERLTRGGGRSPLARAALTLALPVVGLPWHLIERRKFIAAQSEVAQLRAQLSSTSTKIGTEHDSISPDSAIQDRQLRKIILQKDDENLYHYADVIFRKSSVLILPLSEFALPGNVEEQIVDVIANARASASAKYDLLAASELCGSVRAILQLAGRVPELPFPVETLSAKEIRSFVFERGGCHTFINGTLYRFSFDKGSIGKHQELIEHWAKEHQIESQSQPSTATPAANPINHSSVAGIVFGIFAALMSSAVYFSQLAEPSPSSTVVYIVVLSLGAILTFFSCWNLRSFSLTRCPVCALSHTTISNAQMQKREIMTIVMDCYSCGARWKTAPKRWWAMLWLIVGLATISLSLYFFAQSVEEGHWRTFDSSAMRDSQLVSKRFTDKQQEALQMLAFINFPLGLPALGYGLYSLTRKPVILHKPKANQAS